METIRLDVGSTGNFIEFKGRLLFQYSEDSETRYTLYKTADRELGEYVLYVEKDGKKVAYIFGDNDENNVPLPLVDSLPSYNEAKIKQ